MDTYLQALNKTSCVSANIFVQVLELPTAKLIQESENSSAIGHLNVTPVTFDGNIKFKCIKGKDYSKHDDFTFFEFIC